jgi:hypothetical protein
MKYHTISQDITASNFGFGEAKDHLLKAAGVAESVKHPVKRVKFKITFYWE